MLALRGGQVGQPGGCPQTAAGGEAATERSTRPGGPRPSASRSMCSRSAPVTRRRYWPGVPEQGFIAHALGVLWGIMRRLSISPMAARYWADRVPRQRWTSRWASLVTTRTPVRATVAAVVAPSRVGSDDSTPLYRRRRRRVERQLFNWTAIRARSSGTLKGLRMYPNAPSSNDRTTVSSSSTPTATGPGIRSLVPPRMENVEAEHARHQLVEDGQVEILVLSDLVGGSPVGGFDHVVAFCLQVPSDEVANSR